MATITVTKGQIGVEDINFDTGGGTTANTWNRTTSVGGTQAVHKVTAKAVPLEDSNSDWSATNIEEMLDGIQGGTESFKVLVLRGTTDPTIAANNGGIFAKDGSTAVEPLPHYRAESDGDITRVLLGAASFKIWVYANTAGEGWVVDSSVTDTVLAIKGGSNAYNVNGGNPGGTWTQPNHTHTGPSHTHEDGTLYAEIIPNESLNFIYVDKYTASWTADYRFGATLGGAVDSTGQSAGVDVEGQTAASGTGATGGSATAATYRPSASVGTLQYPDVGV